MTYLVMEMLFCLLLAFLLGLCIGWWLGRRKSEEQEDAELSVMGDLNRCQGDLNRCQGDLDRCRQDLDKSKADLEQCQTQLEKCKSDLEQRSVTDEGATPDGDSSAEDELPASGEQEREASESMSEGEDAIPSALVGAAAATAGAGAAVSGAKDEAESDDLTRIEGIGPKISQLLNAPGITTFEQLAATEVSRLQSVLDEAGPRYRVHDPSTWPQQAALAAASSWDELSLLQDRLQGGREVKPDDLKVVEGIGPKIEGLLNAAGIDTWAQLARAEVKVLQSVLDEAGPRYRIHDPGTWPQQASLAAAGSWEELEELQDRLKGGRER